MRPVPVASSAGPAPAAVAAATAAKSSAAGPASIAAAKAAAAARAAAAIRASSRDHRPTPKKRGASDLTSTMVNAANASSAGSSSSGASAKGGENTGRWTAEEHRLFLQGLEQHGKGWKKIASLIKSRTVVQIRTHAQKYFQKLAKARQNGEEGEIAMDGRGPGGVHGGGMGPHGMGGPGGAGSKRRRQASGTKRRAISSVVASAQREAKKRQKRETTRTNAASRIPSSAAAKATAGPASTTTTTSGSTASSSAASTPSSSPPPPHVPMAPALAPFVANPLPAPGTLPSPSTSAAAAAAGISNIPDGGTITTPHGSISTSALEDTLFRFLTPTEGVTVYVPVASASHPGADVARKAGANPITVPGSDSAAVPILGGDISPTGVTDVWTESRDVPSWYASGQDVDELLHEADALDWLSDTGDLHETYIPPPPFAGVINSAHTRKAGTVPRAEPSSEDITKEVMPPMPSESQMFNTAATEESSTKSKSGADPSKAPATAAIEGAGSDLSDPVESPLKTAPAIEPASSTASLFASATEAADATHGAQADPHLDVDVFDAHLDEQAFVSALLENDHRNEEESFPAIH